MNIPIADFDHDDQTSFFISIELKSNDIYQTIILTLDITQYVFKAKYKNGLQKNQNNNHSYILLLSLEVSVE